MTAHRPIRVLHVIHQLGDGGADRALTRLVNGTAPGTFAHTVLALADGPGHERLRPDVRRCVAPRQGGLAAQVAALDGATFDLVHGWVSYASILAATIAAAAGWPLVLRNPTNMDLELLYEPALSATYWPELRRAFQAADAVVVPSRALVDSTRRLTDVEPVVIPNAVDVDDVPAWQPGSREGRPFVIASVGRLSPQKDPLTVVEAAGRLDRRIDWTLRLYGQGNLRGACEQRARDLGIGSRVQFRGFDRTWMRPDAGIDVFVSATRYEGMSNALLEAAAAGLPIVTTAIPENEAVLTDGSDGWLVAPGHADALAGAIADVMTRPGEARRRGAAARAGMRRFSLAAMVEAYSALYAGLGAGRSRTQVA